MSKANKKNNTNENSEKKTSEKNTSEKKPSEKKQRRNLTQCVGFVYGGSIIKTNNVFLFSTDDHKNTVEYVRKNLSNYFGNNVTGRYVKCEDAEETLNKIMVSAKEKKYLAETEDCYILKCNVNNASTLLKEISESSTANTFKLSDDEDKPQKKRETNKSDDEDKPQKKRETNKSVKKNKSDNEADEAKEEEDEEDEIADVDAEEEEKEEIKAVPKKKESKKTSVTKKTKKT